jgi:hypothetical protein
LPPPPQAPNTVVIPNIIETKIVPNDFPNFIVASVFRFFRRLSRPICYTTIINDSLFHNKAVKLQNRRAIRHFPRFLPPDARRLFAAPMPFVLFLRAAKRR